MRHMLGNLSPNYFERTKRYMMLRASQQGTSLTVSGTPPLSLPNSLGKPLKAWEVDVLPYQEGTGDPSPSNVRPIHGTDKVTITTAGKNLFNPSTAQIGYNIDNANGTLIANPTGACSDYIPVIPNNTYRFSPVLTAGNWGAWYDADKVFIAGIANYSIAHTAPSNAAYCRLTVNRNNGNPDWATNFQVEIGSVVTQYEPYQPISQTVLTLPQTVYTGTIGSEGGESRWGEYVFTGDEQWVASATPHRFSFQLNDKGIKAPPITQGAEQNLISSIYGQFVYTNADHVCYAYNVTNGNTMIVVNEPLATTTNEIASIFAGTQLVYELATPTTFAITSPTIPTPTGTATTWATAEDGTVDGMEVTYVGKA